VTEALVQEEKQRADHDVASASIVASEHSG
jgi:hypothetical protein